VFKWFEGFLPQYLGSTTAFTAIMVLYLINSRMNPTAKITWLVLIMMSPVFGAAMLWYTQTDFGHRALKNRMAKIIRETDHFIPQNQRVIEDIAVEKPETVALAKYINRSGCHPAYKNTDIKYFPSGEKKFEELIIQLEQAENFIFMEYFIIDEGIMWGKILEILARKVREGVDVRVMYDGTCEYTTLTRDYKNRLEKLGIKCKVFAPAKPFVSTYYNYRDHRKILVIDGHTAFNGGVNLADEYINEVERFGHWKDTAVMLKGEAVKSFTLMFMQMWNVDSEELDYNKYLSYPTHPVEKARGFVIPYGDCPLDDDKLGERVYMDVLNRAHTYVHIMTPYLILDGEMETAIKFAAERGVEVSIIMPGVPDKKMPYALAKTHYKSLIESGVKIYEYTPGFVHAKVCVSDDSSAIVGTINFDYRSLYHHFECATYMSGTSCIEKIEEDFNETVKKCKLVTVEKLKNEKFIVKLMGILLKSIAPLL
ncbi:MAG: cardiolipin synthase, partial [Firmicutes bacterium]|nr:cardiolipin synthase [Bacillota bacterium]